MKLYLLAAVLFVALIIYVQEAVRPAFATQTAKLHEGLKCQYSDHCLN